jgi:hypothetical protein
MRDTCGVSAPLPESESKAPYSTVAPLEGVPRAKADSSLTTVSRAPLR